MAVFPQDRRGQLLVVFTLLAIGAIYFTWAGAPAGGLWPGITQLNTTRDSLQNQLDSLNRQVQAAQRAVRQGSVARLERALAEYRASLDQMRTLVPASEEVPNLLDDISSRAKVRGANVVNFVPGALESGSPFDTKRARITVTGQYDQIGEFLADISSLPRIIVPYDLRIQRVALPGRGPGSGPDTASVVQLQASFQIRTFVKPLFVDSAARAAQRSGR